MALSIKADASHKLLGVDSIDQFDDHLGWHCFEWNCSKCASHSLFAGPVISFNKTFMLVTPQLNYSIKKLATGRMWLLLPASFLPSQITSLPLYNNGDPFPQDFLKHTLAQQILTNTTRYNLEVYVEATSAYSRGTKIGMNPDSVKSRTKYTTNEIVNCPSM
eukprot:jgi/Psemu1/18688/gm1.18688_g